MKPGRHNGPPAGRDAGPRNVPGKRGLFYRRRESGFDRVTLTRANAVEMAFRNERSDGKKQAGPRCAFFVSGGLFNCGATADLTPAFRRDHL